MQSSTLDDFDADASVDGLANAVYDALGPIESRTTEEENPWWVVDLESERLVESVWVAGGMELGDPTGTFLRVAYTLPGTEDLYHRPASTVTVQEYTDGY
eukprot:3770650-Rhodomonas_salina.2